MSPFFEARRDSKKAIGKVIADLLEIRFRLILEQTLLSEVKKTISLSAPDERAIRNLLPQILPQVSDLSKRFDEAVTLIASYDPLLGYELRSKDFVATAGSLYAKMEAKAGNPIPAFNEFESYIPQFAIPGLDAVILKLSRRYGIFTWFDVKRLLKRKADLPDEMQQGMNLIKEQLETVVIAAQQTAARSDQVVVEPNKQQTPTTGA